jgi:hypothetical protein
LTTGCNPVLQKGYAAKEFPDRSNVNEPRKRPLTKAIQKPLRGAPD